MIDKEAMRATALAESDPLGTKQRFGLFSHPISTAIGDNGPYQTSLHPRADEGKGKPITQPKNIYSGTCRSGQLKKSFFGDLNTLSASGVKDEYLDPARRLLKEENEKFYSSNKNDNKYKPAGNTGTLLKASYPYTEEKQPPLDPRRNREEDGRVRSLPRNAYTNSGRKIIDTYFKHEKHLDDPYNRAHELELEKRKKDKVLEGEAKFKPSSVHSNTFHRDKDVYGEDVVLKAKTSKEAKLNIYNHESNWKGSSPNKHGLYGYFNPFPSYKEDPPNQIKRKIEEEKKDNFKGMSSTLTTPSPSITANSTNLRRYVSSSFSHKM